MSRDIPSEQSVVGGGDDSHRRAVKLPARWHGARVRDAGEFWWSGACSGDGPMPDAPPRPPAPAIVMTEWPPSDCSGPWIAVVSAEADDGHSGRVGVRLEGTHDAPVRWLATLSRLSVRLGDRVLVTRPANWPEPVVVGVLDGIRARGAVPRTTSAVLALRPDECIEICDHRGAALLRVRAGASGPVLSLARADIDLEVAGRLRIRAESLALATTRGNVSIDAADDVIVRGEIIHLNPT